MKSQYSWGENRIHLPPPASSTPTSELAVVDEQSIEHWGRVRTGMIMEKNQYQMTFYNRGLHDVDSSQNADALVHASSAYCTAYCVLKISSFVAAV